MLKVHLECDFTKCDKTFRNFDADLPAGRVDETRMAYKEGFDGMVDSSSLSQPASLPHGHVPVPMVMVGKIKTPTEKDPKGTLFLINLGNLYYREFTKNEIEVSAIRGSGSPRARRD